MTDERKAPEDRQDRAGHTPEQRAALQKVRRHLYEELAAGSPDEEDGK